MLCSLECGAHVLHLSVVVPFPWLEAATGAHSRARTSNAGQMHPQTTYVHNCQVDVSLAALLRLGQRIELLPFEPKSDTYA